MAPGSSAEKLGVRVVFNHTVPITQHTEKIMVTVTGPSTGKGNTAHLDLVVALDTSGSMEGRKLHDMQQAAYFIIGKVGKLDTLTFVPFASKAATPSTTEFMSDKAKARAKHFVHTLRAHGNTNIKDGLSTAVSILHHRTDRTGRAGAVLLMSDGYQNTGDARDVDAHDFPVFTFGFGHKHDSHLLKDIAHKSRHRATYNNTPHSHLRNTLLRSFAKIVGILRDISALDVLVTLRPHAGATILPLSRYLGHTRVTSGDHGSIIYHVGDLARKDHHRIIVEIQLPSVHNNEKAKTVMVVECKYRLPNRREMTDTHNIQMARDRKAKLHPPGEHFKVELTRHDQAHSIGRMMKLADEHKLDKAMDVLADAKNALRRSESTAHDAATMAMLDHLSLELESVEQLLESREAYTNHGRAYMLAAISSHESQRFAVRGGDEDVMLFALPRMLKYARQADQFHRNPNVHI